MKTPAMFWVAITTLLLITVTVMSAMTISFSWIFYLTIIGQVFVAIMVYKVLKVHYFTDKTFEHLYEDKPFNYRK